MANTSYFSAENSWKRLFFITGKTADEFYMDSGIKMNIEQAIWQELKETDMNVLYFLIMIRSYIVMTMNPLNY